jgi:hypothetical protein
MYFNRPAQYTAGIVCKGLLMVMLLSVYTNVIQWLEHHQLPCLFKSLFHFDCLGCGFQRSAVLLLKGNFFESIKMYPAFLPIVFFILFLSFNKKMQLPKTGLYIKMSLLIIFSIITVTYIYKLIN